jgi:hypothetical protein
MPETLLVECDRLNAEYLRQAAEAAHHEGQLTLAHYKEGLILRTVSIVGVLDSAIVQCWSLLEEDYEETTCQRLGENARGLFDALSSLLTLFKQESEELGAKGVQVATAYVLDPALAKVREARERFERDWPWPGCKWPQVNREMVRKSREQIAAGQLLDAEELIREAQGHSDR